MANLTQILDNADLDALRKHFDPAIVIADVQGVLDAHPTAAAPWKQLVLSSSSLDAATKALIPLALLTAERGWPWTLRIHIYLALTMGQASVLQVLDALSLSGTYAGADNYIHALIITEGTLRDLKGLCSAGKYNTAEVVQAMKHA